MSAAVDVILGVCVAVLAASALLVLVRLEKGPTILDRAVSLDVTTAVVLGSVALMTAMTGRTDLVPVLAVLAIVGFVGSVALGRFVAADTPEEARILSAEELARAEAERQVDDAAAPVHDPDADDDDAIAENEAAEADASGSAETREETT